jgi:hypothetical protein
MVFCVSTMKNFDNDNELLTFISLAAATANVTRYLGLNKQKDEDACGDRDSRDAEEKKRHENREYIEHRLRELRAWERKISGSK